MHYFKNTEQQEQGNSNIFPLEAMNTQKQYFFDEEHTSYEQPYDANYERYGDPNRGW